MLAKPTIRLCYLPLIAPGEAALTVVKEAIVVRQRKAINTAKVIVLIKIPPRVETHQVYMGV